MVRQLQTKIHYKLKKQKLYTRRENVNTKNKEPNYMRLTKRRFFTIIWFKKSYTGKI
jgi:hypothetical protein